MFEYRRMASRPSLIAILTALASVPATATDKEITDDRTSKITSTTEIGTAAGTLTLGTNGSVDVTSGTAIEVNGPHRLVVLGNITTDGKTDGRGIWFNSAAGRQNASLSLTGDLVIGDTSTDFDLDATTNVRGLELSGMGFTGDFSINSGSAMTVNGADGRGVLIDAPLTGNFVNNGSISMQGNRAIAIDVVGNVSGNVESWGAVAARYADTYGIRTLGEIGGAFTVGGSVQVGRASYTDEDDVVQPASAAKAGVYVGNNVDGGIVFQGIGANNDLDFNDDGTNDITGDSAVITTGGTAALIIENTRADKSDQIIGLINGEDNLSLVNRGNFSVTGGSAGISATGIILGSAASGAGKTVFEGEMAFDLGTLAVTSLNGNATGIHLKGGVDLPGFFNSGQIAAATTRSTTTATDGTVTYGAGGNATAIQIDAGNDVSRIYNSGRISADAAGEGKVATAILDKSGTITTFQNVGTITAIASNGTANAIDFRANTTGTWLRNAGTITGNVLLGSGNDSVIVDEGTIDGDLSFGLGRDKLQLLNGGEISGSINYEGSLAFIVDSGDLTIGATSVLNATTADFKGEGNITIAVDAANNTAGKIAVSDLISIGNKVTITPELDSFVREDRSFNLITAGRIDFADAGASLELAETPYLFDVELDATDTSVTLNLRPKTAEELGLTNQLAIIHSELLSDTEFDSSLESYVANLKTAGEVNNTFRALMPDVSNDSYNILLMSERRTSRMISERLESVGTTRNDDGSIWGAQHFERLTAGDDGAMLPGTVTSTGLTFGIDQSVSDSWLLGIAAGFVLDQTDRTEEIGSEISMFSPFLTGYALARYGNAHLALSSSLRYTDISRERDLILDIEERTIQGDTTGLGISGSAEIGYDLALGNFHFKPTGLVRALHYKESGYTEEGGFSAGYEVGKRSMNRVEGELGARLQYEIEWRRGNGAVKLVPELRATYAKAISGDEYTDISARFENAEEAFIIQSDKLYDNLKSFGGGVALFGNGATGRIAYDYRDYGTLTGHSAMLTVSLSF
ncbi:autotransporter outer membrane beta-barrel domain-containing protein [Gimibacter soli]|uniref:Autotransporter outer membrane beta-barrel domain-containing protein n=1 Tax=Gimibacter soli TaxID=3024400 RepID=A0AAE9XRN9_9PROT|nr:autotransporter outer membrane beta-barrel domain-containing protein [Gimibacter soli]WCL53961.1 autotransporter outer membrane beta-barrel domain-containing protein [Gimibacter soli]